VTTNQWDTTEEDAATIADWSARLERLPHLYRYASIRGARFDWFRNLTLGSTLYFPSFKDLNDPFEGRVRPIADGTPEEIRAFWERSQYTERGLVIDADARAEIERAVALPPHEAQRRMYETYEKESAKAGIACFSERQDDLPMWSYYADAHRGVCLRFLTAHFWNPPLAGCFAPAPVTYGEYPIISFFRGSRFSHSTAMGWTKAECWEHEREWRILRHEGGPGLVPFDPAALDGVIMGCRMSDEDEARVRDVLSRRDPRPELLKARPAAREFKLVVEPVGGP
jgi:hypothetical protein